MKPAKLLPALALSLLLLSAGPALRAEDPKQETPEARAKRLKILEGQIREQVKRLPAEDSVERGIALEAIAAAKGELEELGIDGLVEAVREAGLAAEDRFVAVLAGEILAELDPVGTLDWLDQEAFSGQVPPRRRAMALAMLSEIRDERAGKLAATYAGGGPAETRVQALVALAKLQLPGTYGTLIDALGSQEKAVKDNAALALGRLKDDRAIPNLLAHLEDADGDHPAFAAWALKQFEDPSVCDAVLSRLSSDSGEPGDAKARIIESCAGPQHVEKLRAVLRSGRFVKYQYAAALALGRILEEKEDVETQKLLLAGLQKNGDPRVRAACFLGLSRCATGAIAKDVAVALSRLVRARSDDQHRIFRALAFLAGDLKTPLAGPALYQAGRIQQNELTWRVAAVNFWKCADPNTRRQVKDEFEVAADDRLIARLAEFIGRSTRVEEFQFLMKNLRRHREGSDACFAVEMGLEHMTGHFFGPDYAVWRHWHDKNPGFFEPRTYRIDRRKWQKEFSQKDREFRQTPETERAVQLGLAWLSRHQSHDGALDPNRFFDMCTRDPSCKKTGSRHMLDPVGTTALAALAFLGGGYSPESGKYKDTVRRLLTYLEVRQTADGNYTSTDLFQGYNRPIAVYALSEAYNVSGNLRYMPYVERGIGYLVEIQNELGGWHYQATSRGTDTSVMSWVLLGLGVAHKSGFGVRESVFEGCDMILDLYSERVTQAREEYLDIDPAYSYEVGRKYEAEHQTGYRSKVSENATTSFGLMARMFLGWRRSHPFCIGSANFILNRNMEQIPKAKNWEKYTSKNRFPSYAWYYGTLAMHQMGGRFFRQWNAVIKELLPGIQLEAGCDAGAWEVRNYDFVAGKVYTTCMGVLTLETYYRYKPFCEEGAPEEEGTKDEDDD